MIKPAADSREIEERYSVVRSTTGYGRLHEEAIREAYEAVLRPADSAIDAGAHSGKHTLPMSRAVGPRGRVLAFEPSPQPFQRLQDALHTTDSSNVIAIPKAVSDNIQGSQPFLVFTDRPGVSGFERRSDAAGNLPATEISVETTTIDTYLDDLGPTGFIKLDVEGAELQALGGAREVVGRHLPVIHVEASYISWDAFGYGPAELLEFCEEFRYRVVDVLATPLQDVAALDTSFQTPSVWDYILIPPTDRGRVADQALRAHSSKHYGLVSNT